MGESKDMFVADLHTKAAYAHTAQAITHPLKSWPSRL
jgi:hypothetical protein